MQSNAWTAHLICGDPSRFDVVFTDADGLGYRTARHRDPNRNAICNAALRAGGIFKSPGKLYHGLALDDAEPEHTDRAVTQAAADLARTRATAH